MRPTAATISPSPGRTAMPPTPMACCAATARISPLELLPAFRSGAPLVDLQVAVGVHRASLGPLRLRHRRDARRPAARAQMVHVFLGLITTPRTARWRGCRCCAGASRRSCCARACGPTATPGAGCSPRCAPCPATSCSRRRPPTCCGSPSWLWTGLSSGTVGVFARMHLNRDFVSVLVYFPADRFGPETRRKVAAVDRPHWPGEVDRPRRPDRRAGLRPDAVPDRVAARAPAGLAGASTGRGRRSLRSPAGGVTTSATC